MQEEDAELRPLHPVQKTHRCEHKPRGFRPPAPGADGAGRCEGRGRRRRQHPRTRLQPTSPGQPHRQERPKPTSAEAARLHLGYRVHTACCANSEMPLAFTVVPCNMNDRAYFKPLLERAREAKLMRRMKHFTAWDEAGPV
ncbi:MAG: transposase [Candidatus Bathyarchaeia archaeon]